MFQLAYNTKSMAAVSQVFLWIAIIASLMILLPQVIKMHKNKYADTNTSILVYVAYLAANLSWAIYQLTYNLSDDPATTEKSQQILYWIQFGGYAIQTILGAYSLGVKIHYTINAKDQKNSVVSKLVTRRAEVAVLVKKEKNPMRQITDELISQYPKLQVIVEKHAVHHNLTVSEYLDTKNTVELTAINAQFIKKIMSKKFNPLDENIKKLYNRYSTFVVSKIYELSVNYLDSINALYNYRVNKLPWYKLNKPAKTEADLKAYLERIDLVDKWSFLSQIYESIANI